MKTLTPITTESIRRVSILIFIALFAWMYFYTPSDIYEIKVQNYLQNYQYKVKNGSIDASKTSLDDYITQQMKGAYSWSSRVQKIVEVEGDHSKFLNHIKSVNVGESFDAFINERRSPDTFWSSNSYFFRSKELPQNFLSQTFLKHPDYLMSKNRDGEKSYFQLYNVKRTSMLDDAPVFIAHPLRIYAYLLLLLSLVVYLIVPQPKIPEGAAFYTKLNAVYLPDMLSVFLWTAAWMFFFLPDDSAPAFVRYFFLVFFGIFALAIVLPVIKYASNWYLFTKDTFEWSGSDGIGKVSLEEIVSIEPYKRQLPKWVAWLIIVFGRGQPGATGIGMITGASAPEIGMDIITKSGRKIRVMANYLQTDTTFTKRFQELDNLLNDHDTPKKI